MLVMDKKYSSYIMTLGKILGRIDKGLKQAAAVKMRCFAILVDSILLITLWEIGLMNATCCCFFFLFFFGWGGGLVGLSLVILKLVTNIIDMYRYWILLTGHEDLSKVVRLSTWYVFFRSFASIMPLDLVSLIIWLFGMHFYFCDIAFVSARVFFLMLNFQVGLALVVEGEIVLGVMGCPNWQDGDSEFDTEVPGDENTVSRSGIIMISHVGCGTWRTRLWDPQNSNTKMAHNWTRCLVDRFHQVHEARFCIPDSQTWESLPLSTQFSVTTLASSVGEKQILLLPTCCGRFTFKSWIIVSIPLLYAYVFLFVSLSIPFSCIWDGRFFESDKA